MGRSARRRRSVSARRDGDRIVVSVPATLSAEQERHWVAEMLRRLERGDRRRRAPRSDDDLMRRARQLAQEYLGGAARPSSVRWVAPMRSRWASCTPATATIRIDERLRSMPGWVLDYVLVHELAHLLEAGHGPRFWALVANYPRTDRAVGYLEGVSAAAGLGIETAAPGDD